MVFPKGGGNDGGWFPGVEKRAVVKQKSRRHVVAVLNGGKTDHCKITFS